MSAAAKFLTRVFLVTSLTFGGVMGLLYVALGLAVGTGFPSVGAVLVLVGAAGGVAGGILFGIAMSLTCGLYHVYCVRRLGFPLTDETLAVRQRRTLTLDLPYAEAFRLCTEAIRRLGRTCVTEETDYDAGVIHSVKGPSWSSFGENIRFELRDLGGRTEVMVECRPRMRTALADNGVNLRNMDGIMGFLVAHGASGDGRPVAIREGYAAVQDGVQSAAADEGEGAGIVRAPSDSQRRV